MTITKPQAALLARLVSHDRTHDRMPVCATYKPAIALVAAGLAEWQEGTFTTFLVVTDAGKAEHERRQNA